MTTAAELAKQLRNRCSLNRKGRKCTNDLCLINVEAADLLDRVAKLEAVAVAAMNVARYPALRSPMVELKGALRELEEK